MLEVVFSDSACGGLKYAQHYGEGPYRPGCIGVIFSQEDGEPAPAEVEAAQRRAEEAERLAWERAVPLGGSPADVLGISLNLSAGDISEEVPGPKRRAALLEQFGFVSQEDMEADVEKLMAQANHALERVLAESARGEDIRRGGTSFGPHREDLVLTIQGKDMRLFASQGQMRTAALAMKLSELAVFQQMAGEPPVLLLDDVMSELDLNRRKRLLDEIRGVQTLITCTDESDLNAQEKYVPWRVYTDAAGKAQVMACVHEEREQRLRELDDSFLDT